MKVLLGSAITDTRDFLQPEQLANSVPSGMDSLVHDARMLCCRHVRNQDFVVVSIDARNAFNAFSRERTLHSLPQRAPSLARFANVVYVCTTSQLVLPSTPPRLLQSREGTQQGDPPSMLFFSLAMQPLIRRISQTCKMYLNRWYADDGTLAGPLTKVLHALRLLISEGPSHQCFLNPSKIRMFWPCPPAEYPPSLVSVLPTQNISSEGLELLGVPIGTSAFMARHMRAKLQECDTALTLLDDISDARTQFHLHRMTASVCRVQHMFRLVPPRISTPFAKAFHDSQLKSYSHFNNVPVSASVASQIGLPFRLGGHGLIAITPFLDASYAASLIDSAPSRLIGPSYPTVSVHRRDARPHLRAMIAHLPACVRPANFNLRLPPDNDYKLDTFQPETLVEQPERINKHLIQVIHQAAGDRYWEKDPWQAHPNPSTHSTYTIRIRVRFHSTMAPGASAFLNAHPSVTKSVHNTQWTIMLRRHLDVPVYEDSIAPLRCNNCIKHMDHRGDHATHCKLGFGPTHRHNSLRNKLVQHLFRPAGRACKIEVSFLLPNASHHPADVLVEPPQPPPGSLPGKPTAYDITMRSPYT